MFNIGDRIKIKPYDELATTDKNNRVGTLCGSVGVIKRKLIDGETREVLYEVHLDGYDVCSRKLFSAGSLIPEETLPKVKFDLRVDTTGQFVLCDAINADGEIIASAFGKILGNDYEAILTGAKYALQFLESKIKITNRTWEDKYHV